MFLLGRCRVCHGAQARQDSFLYFLLEGEVLGGSGFTSVP